MFNGIVPFHWISKAIFAVDEGDFGKPAGFQIALGIAHINDGRKMIALLYQQTVVPLPLARIAWAFKITNQIRDSQGPHHKLNVAGTTVADNTHLIGFGQLPDGIYDTLKDGAGMGDQIIMLPFAAQIDVLQEAR